MLDLQNDTFESLRSHALSEYPKECCGIILGIHSDEPKKAYKIIQTENVIGSKQAAAHFRIDPLAVLQAELSAEQEQLEITGFYHSHPDHTAFPSEQDIASMIAGYSYLIISVRKGECTDMRSFERLSQTALDIREEILIKEK